MTWTYFVTLAFYICSLMLKTFTYNIKNQTFIKFPNFIYLILIILAFIPIFNAITGLSIFLYFVILSSEKEYIFKLKESSIISNWLSKKW